jgi:membrane protease YdiL (CAAX protease family)
LDYAPSVPSRPPAGTPVTWGPRDVFWGILIGLGVLVLTFVAVAAPFAAAFGADSAAANAAAALSQALFEVLTVAAIVMLVRRSGGDLASLGWRRPVPPADRAGFEPGGPALPAPQEFPWAYTAGVIAAGLVACFVALYVYLAIVSVLGIDVLEPGRQIPEDYFSNPVVVAMLGLGVVVAAPVCEETFFRGFVFGGLRASLGFWPAAFVSGFFFSMAHFQLGLVVPFGVIGIILAWVYNRSSSLVPNMGIHFLFNLMQFLVLVLVPGAR